MTALRWLVRIVAVGIAFVDAAFLHGGPVALPDLGPNLPKLTLPKLESLGIRRIDYTWGFQGDALPSDFFRRNVLLSFQEDGLAIQLRGLIGADRLMWGSDYPHPESTFPESRHILERILAGVPEAEQRLIAGANAARLYGFSGV